MPDSATITVVQVYRSLLGTYGDSGNALALAARARRHQLDVEEIDVPMGQPVPRLADVYLLGGAEDLAQGAATALLREDGGVAAAAASGALVFAVCAGYQMLGESFEVQQGRVVDGLGLLDVVSRRMPRRAVGEVVADPAVPGTAVPIGRLTGFENHASGTTRGPGVAPLATTSQGVGNGDGTDGACSGRIVGTYLHGAVLARNAGLSDFLLTTVAGPLEPLTNTAEDQQLDAETEALRADRFAAVPHDARRRVLRLPRRLRR